MSGGMESEAEDLASLRQIGGSHYQLAIQPAEFIHKNGIGFLEGNVIKYVVRHAAKAGRQDLEKARHYIDLLLEYQYPASKPAKSHGWTLEDEVRRGNACASCED